ncbi:MAG TPA: ABC transporter ATP-binding protein [Jatrophihabitans sp.]|uniref:ABC transporter ATP-binding protein n=1 Tax=Jatrophihabitans sp. TaxID=1932789 RepID=UPI002F011779
MVVPAGTSSATQAGALVELAEVTKTRRQGRATVTSLAQVSLTILPGQIVAVTGPSGAGKSTLLQLVGGLEIADSGSIHVDGVNIAELSGKQSATYRGSVGFVFQRYHLLSNLSALDNVITPVLPLRVDFDKQKRGHELLAAVGLADQSAVLARELSGGQQQRVAIARALVNRPRLLLADEPTGNLDSRTGEEILDLLSELQAEHGMTMLLATHDSTVASQCQRLVGLRDGRVVSDHDLPGADPDSTLRRITGPG